MNRHGHEDRAERILERVVQERGDDASRLESFARDLMTNQETMGQYDEMALAQRLPTKVRQGKGDHARAFDTMALAHFLNGDAEQAVALQRIAAQNQKSSEYRRRLRTYEAALELVVPNASLLTQVQDHLPRRPERVRVVKRSASWHRNESRAP